MCSIGCPCPFLLRRWQKFLVYIIIIITSRDSPPSASFFCYGAPLTTFPQQHFDDGASSITILVDIMMLGQCMLLVIASEMVNRMPILGLMECKASDYGLG